MADRHVPIGQVKRELLGLANRVTYGGERIVLTSRGKPKAALVSLDDYERLTRGPVGDRVARWQTWLAQADALVADILTRRDGVPISVGDLLHQERDDLEARSDWVGES